MDDLVAIINKLSEEVRDNLPHARREVNRLIKNKETSIIQIEQTLDLLLSFSLLGYGQKEFERLNAYYKKIHPKNSQAYSRIKKTYLLE